MNGPAPQHALVDTAEALTELCAELATSPWLALDTEFLRERTYYSQLCLLQVAGEKTAACVDVLALPTIEPLLALLQQTSITKIVHAGRQDFEILHYVYKILPGPVFDTQLAAALAFGADQIGYAALVDRLLGVRLEKAHTRADWSRRPLSDAELTYALEDVRYLGALYLQLKEQLREAGRLEWLNEAFADLLKPETYIVDPDQAWRRVKDCHRMRGIELAVLQALAAWREREAIARDLPRKWVLSDDVAADLAKRRPQTLEALTKVRGLDARMVLRHGKVLLDLVAQASMTPPAQWPAPEQRRPLSSQEEIIVDMLAATVKLCAAEAGVTPALVASRVHLEDAVRHRDGLLRLEGWRDAIAGDALRRVLAGRAELVIHEGRPVLREVGNNENPDVTNPAASNQPKNSPPSP